jgi:hypothetical protein
MAHSIEKSEPNTATLVVLGLVTLVLFHRAKLTILEHLISDFDYQGFNIAGNPDIKKAWLR